MKNTENPLLSKNQLEIECDFPFIPFIKHCSTSPNNGCDIVSPNMSEQSQILYYIDSFNASLSDLISECDFTDFHIYTESVKFDYRNNNIQSPKTFLHFIPYTPTGKKSKYPISIVFSTEEDWQGIGSDGYKIIDNYEHGRISFMQDGNIGKANINLFRNYNNYFIKYKLFGTTLVIDKITLTNIRTNQSNIIYSFD